MAQPDVIQENLFQAVDTIVQNRIANLPYDKTIECEILEQVITEKNLYKVQYQGVSFEATSIVTDLKQGDIVYVQVPQSDFRKEKFIIALKRDATTQKVKTLPFLSFIKGNNLFSNIINQSEFNLQLNSHKEVEKQFTFIRFDGEEQAYGFTRLGLKATFGAAINTPLVSGDYGIRIRIYGYNSKDWSNTAAELQSMAEIQKNSEYFHQDFYLKKEDMIGTNLYNTHGFQNQEKVFDITGWVIDSIVVSLWQDNEFKDMNGTEIVNKFVTVTNLQLYLGYDISQVRPYGEPTLLLSTKDGFLYKTPAPSDPYLSKHVELKVIQREENTNNYYEDSRWLTFKRVLDDSLKFEQYDPTSETSSIYSKKYYFVPFTISNWTYQPLSDELVKVIGADITLNPNYKFLDQHQCGYCYTLPYSSTGYISTTVQRAIQALSPADYDTYYDYVNAIQELISTNYNLVLTSVENDFIKYYYQEVVNHINSKSQYCVSNELWFVHESNKDLLDELLNTGVEKPTEEEITIAGALVYSGPELLFKASDGTVLLRLNVNNSSFMGNADSATYFKVNNDKYNLYANLQNIETALRALGSNFKLLKEE